MRTQKIPQATLVVLTCTALAVAFVPPAQAQTQAAMNRMAVRDADKADAAMNIAYKQLMALLNPAQKVQLKKSQRAWLVYRDADADLLSSQWTGGTGQPMIYELSLQDITQARTKELKEFMKEVLQESGGR